jgi:Zn-dependent protease with chaperone function
VTRTGGRRITGTTLLLLVPLVPLILFGVARAAAPVSVLGILLHDPWTYAVLAVVLVVVGGLLMSLRPVEAWAARVLFGMRSPTPEEQAAIEPGLARACGAAGIRRDRLLVRVEDSHAANAYAAAGHIVCVTTGALRLPEPELEAVLGHELGHQTELHPTISAMTWWLSLPAVPLKAALRFLQRLIAAVAGRLGGLARPVGIVLAALLWIVAVQLLWLVWVADVLTAAIARRTEFDADAAAVDWGYGAQLLAAYDVLGAGEQPKGRLARLADHHPPMDERIVRIRERIGR